VHIVTGAPASGKSAFIKRMCVERGDWLGLVNPPVLNPVSNLKPMTAGCPCCTGKVVLQVTLARALRASGARRAFVELGDVGHLDGLERALFEAPLGSSIVISRAVCLPRDGQLACADFER